MYMGMCIYIYIYMCIYIYVYIERSTSRALSNLAARERGPRADKLHPKNPKYLTIGYLGFPY